MKCNMFKTCHNVSCNMSLFGGSILPAGTTSEKEFDIVVPFFYILLWSCHLAAIKSTIQPAKDVIPTSPTVGTVSTVFQTKQNLVNNKCTNMNKI